MDRRNWISKATLGSTAVMMLPHLGIAMPKTNLGEAYLRLASNENPYGCSEQVKKSFSTSASAINRYAFASIPELKLALAKRFQLTSENILLGAGSSGLLEAVAQFMLQREGDVTTATPTFDILPAMLEKFGRKTHYIPLKQDHTLDLNAMLDKTKEHPGLVYIVNPNNPIGTAVGPKELRQFITEATKYSYVLIDEAYLEFCDNSESMIDMVVNPRVMVIKTFSKVYGLAGLRIGYGFAHAAWVDALEKYMIFAGLPISSPAFSVATAALDDQNFVDFVVQKNTESKTIVVETLRKLKIDYIPSQTSFILFDISKYPTEFMTDMKNKGILIGTRDYLGKNWCRVSMGTVEETKEFTKVLTELWKA
ncbi:histidinol-phosphate aminotransferase family protein [Arenibacter algicola]|uniref:pyridoxal phosphate-dependent aminotransferase n=1 Tax=Arenibacter algicola TaxID=616991 RepID=UPI001C077ABE|nr:histidinol-phosphate transaminase [Arenibacter algicola]MBU2905577.1 histidinol-phosphate aminotransferase family protein [Arenibacter algicola]